MEQKHNILPSLARYASDPSQSKGRLYPDHTATFVNPFERDLNRITRSSAFRRLGYKTQVFANDKGDHYRTRLTHSIEVSQVGRVIANALHLSRDLTEVLCLAHDIGHPPFGHSGERVLDKYMQNYGGFNHNVFTLKLLTKLEEKYVDFEGLNLTWETLEGLVKHNGPLIGKHSKGEKLHDYILEYNEQQNLNLDKFPSLEAQVASLADDIAYNCHDLEDALRAKLFTIEDLYESGVATEIMDAVFSRAYDVPISRITNEILKRLTNMFIVDLVETSTKNIQEDKIETISDVHNANRYLIGFSEKAETQLNHLRKFFIEKMFTHRVVQEVTFSSEIIIGGLFEKYLENPGLLPEKWRERIKNDKHSLYNTVCDYIAGMTDRFVTKEYQQLCK